MEILVTVDDKALVEEVLFPFDFRREKGAAGVDIAGMMLDTLLTRHAKSRV